MITVFTPTYNRAHTLTTLYHSLCSQSSKNFEWLIVDDGSTDDTEEVVRRLINEDKINLRYFKQQNGGKHRAINRGVQEAKEVLFFIVDSDDYLLPRATEVIANYYVKVLKEDVAGVSFRRGYNINKVIGSPVTFVDFFANVFTVRFVKKISGDMAEVYKTAILQKYPFPDIRGEKFCAEGLIWNRIGLSYKLLWTSQLIYICNYLPGGLTSESVKNRIKAPTYATLYYSELSKAPVPLFQKLKASINYWRFAGYQHILFKDKLKKINFVYTIVAFPIAQLLILKDKLK